MRKLTPIEKKRRSFASSFLLGTSDLLSLASWPSLKRLERPTRRLRAVSPEAAWDDVGKELSIAVHTLKAQSRIK